MNPTTKKRTKAYTTTTGERVTKFNDGSETRVAQNVPTPTATPQPTTDLSSGIPGSLATNQTPGVQLPPVTPPIDTANEAKTAGQAYLDTAQAEAKARLDQAQAPITAGEQNIRNLMGLANTESATRQKLEEAGGVNRIQEDLRKAEQSIAQQIAAIDDFDDMTAFNTEEMRLDAASRDVTKGTFGAQSAEYNLQRALQRRGQAAQLRATIAANAALQGNLELATEQVDKALASIYDPIKQDLQMEQFFLQRNDKRFDSAQKEVSDLRMKAIERTFADIDRATNLVDTAVASGYANSEDIKTMTSLSGNPQAQADYARGIVAKGRAAKIAQENALFNAQLAKINSDILANGQQGTTAESVQIQSAKNTDLLNHVRQVSSNTAGLKALTAGGLAYQAGQLTKSLTSSAFGGAVGGGAVGSVVPGAGTVAGAAAGFLGGAALGTAGYLTANAKAKEDALASINYLVQNASFQSLRDLKTSGISFGALSNAERTAAGSAANALVASIEIDPETGQPTGIIGSYENFMENVNTVEKAFQTNQDRLVNSAIPPEIQSEIDAVYNQ